MLPDPSEVLERVKPVSLLATVTAGGPASEPVPVQPLTVKVLPPIPLVSARSARVIPLRLSARLPELSVVLDRLKPAALLAATVAAVPVREPPRVQPPTSKRR